MRMSTDRGRDEELSVATIMAAAHAGVTVFDTAHAYAPDPGQLGHNERLLARALRGCGRDGRVVTKGGMARPGGGWVPDGRAKSILADCEASLAALDGAAIDLYLLHAPDPRTPWRTSVRALARLAESGLVRRVGLSNVNRRQLDEACELAPIAAVQMSLNWFDAEAVRGGVLDRCTELGIALMAHSPLGGPGRAAGLARQPAVAEVALRAGATPAEVALAWLLELSPAVVAIPGARRPETARSAARVASLVLDAADRAILARAFGGTREEWPADARSARARSALGAPSEQAEVVLVMGIPGAGKSRVAETYVERGYVRLNRDERGGSLRGLADVLDEQLSAGTRRVVLDNTYLSRSSRSYVIDVAARHGIPVRCLWLDTPLDQAQVNLVERTLVRFGSLPSPEEMRALARREPGLLMPTRQMRAVRELEPPSAEEGFTSVDLVPFERTVPAGHAAGGVLIAAAALDQPGWPRVLVEVDRELPCLLFDWRPGGGPEDLACAAAQLAADLSGLVEVAVCPHPGGPPACWCRPPLPGLPLAFSRSHDLELARTSLVGVSAAHRTLARTLGCRYVAVS